MKKITRISESSTGNTKQSKLRVAAYARVSTDNDEQLVSLDTQIKHYESYIKANSDCENKKIDFIVTKSISRFARNTTDCLELVRKLLALGIFIYFEKENINTGSMESELMLSILSGLAESESVSIAENNKWAIKRRFQNGTYKISCPPYGYDVTQGNLIVNELQAEIVRFIFAELLSGKSTGKVAEELNLRGIKVKKSGRWTPTTIRGIAGNERYTGDAIFQKTYTDAHFKRHYNYGEEDQFLIENHHEAIISHEDYNAVQAIIRQRGKEKGIENQQKKYQNRYPFSGKIRCGECGGSFKRRIHSSGRHSVAWCCSNHIVNANNCPIKYIPEQDFHYAFVTMMNKLIFGSKTILKPLLSALSDLRSESVEEMLYSINRKLEKNAEQRKVLITFQSRGYLEPAVYKKGNNELLQEAEQLKHQKESISRLIGGENKNLHEVKELFHYVSKAAMLTNFDEALFTRFVERVLVYSRDEIAFELKCGLSLKERLVKQ